MKKLLILLLSIMMAFALTACGGSDESKPDNSSPSEYMSQEYLNMMKGKSYYMDYNAEMNGTEVNMKIAVDGDNMATEAELEGTVHRILVLGDSMYLLDTQAKTYMEMSVSMDDIKESAAEIDDDVKFAEKGEGEIKGETIPYEKWAWEDGEIFYYFDGGKLKYIVSSSEGASITMTVNEMTKDIPSGFMELPEDYTKLG